MTVGEDKHKKRKGGYSSLVGPKCLDHRQSQQLSTFKPIFTIICISLISLAADMPSKKECPSPPPSLFLSRARLSCTRVAWSGVTRPPFSFEDHRALLLAPSLLPFFSFSYFLLSALFFIAYAGSYCLPLLLHQEELKTR